MPTTLEKYGVADLTAAERLELADALHASLSDDLEKLPLTSAQADELARRVALADADPDRGVPWEAVLAAVRARRAT